MNPELEDRLTKAQEQFNFFTEQFEGTIEEVHIFYEDCDNCPAKDECANKEDFMKGGLVLVEMHDFIQDKGIDSTLHPLTSEDNGELGQTVSEKGGVLPLSMIFTDEMPVCAPNHNFFFVKLEDGRRLLYLLETPDMDSDDETQDLMIYR